jgi:p-aminobenzoyl-glutamate transporter AbgT
MKGKIFLVLLIVVVIGMVGGLIIFRWIEPQLFKSSSTKKWDEEH